MITPVITAIEKVFSLPAGCWMITVTYADGTSRYFALTREESRRIDESDDPFRTVEEIEEGRWWRVGERERQRRERGEE